MGGWGNLGGGVTQIVMGSVLFPLFKLGMSAEMAWRTVCIVPAVVGLAVGVSILFISDDAPKGSFCKLFDMKPLGKRVSTDGVQSYIHIYISTIYI